VGVPYSTNGEKRNAYMLLWESQMERDRWEDQDLGGWIILGWVGVMCTGLVWLRMGASEELL
jgi:hypothetical protein